ncbi:MAG: alpha/beta fold hydrolase [Candidatus Dormibacteraceae bacterium]
MCAGVSLNRESWRSWYPHLADSFNLMALDVPGYGESKIDDHALVARQVSDWADYIIAVMDDAGVSSAFMVGEQTGGAAVLFAALRRPERLKAAAIVATPFQGAVIRGTIGAYTSASTSGGIAAWSDYMVPALLYPTPNHSIAGELRRWHLTNDLSVILHDGASWANVDMEGELPSLTTPTLILAPGSSPVIPREHSLEMERLIPDTELILFGALGQLMAFTNSAECAYLTRQFFRSRAQNRSGE